MVTRSKTIPKPKRQRATADNTREKMIEYLTTEAAVSERAKLNSFH